MKTKLVSTFLLVVFLSACGLLDTIVPETPIGGDQSELGMEGATFAVSGVSGLTVKSAEVTSLEDGISTIKTDIVLTDDKLKKWDGFFPYDYTVNGNSVAVEFKGRITSKGIQTLHDGKYFTLVNFNSGVGDKYQHEVNGNTITREVVSKSTTDDYSYVFFNIKVSEVEETGMGLPGVSKIVYYANHKFGLVGVKAVFEDGTEKKITIY